MASPAVSMISFTGSSMTGTKIMEACAPKLSRCALELGGVRAGGLRRCGSRPRRRDHHERFLTNGGQICTAHTRLVVQKDLEAPLLDRLKQELEKLRFSADPILKERMPATTPGRKA